MLHCAARSGGLAAAVITLWLGLACSKDATAPTHPSDHDDGSAAAQTPSTPPAASGSACKAQLVWRESPIDQLTECTVAIEQYKALAVEHFACTTDSDCSIFSAAGGCLGMNVATTMQAQVKPYPDGCVKNEESCRGSDFSDHRVRCSNGCCEIFEE